MQHASLETTNQYISTAEGCPFCDGLGLVEAMHFYGSDQTYLFTSAARWLTRHSSPDWHVASTALSGWPGAWRLTLYLEESRHPHGVSEARNGS